MNWRTVRQRERDEWANTKRCAKAQAQQSKELDRLTAILIKTLPRFLGLHYGDPTIGKTGAMLNGPTIVKLNAATTLHTLLQQEQLPCKSAQATSSPNSPPSNTTRMKPRRRKTSTGKSRKG